MAFNAKLYAFQFVKHQEANIRYIYSNPDNRITGFSEEGNTWMWDIVDKIIIELEPQEMRQLMSQVSPQNHENLQRFLYFIVASEIWNLIS